MMIPWCQAADCSVSLSHSPVPSLGLLSDLPLSLSGSSLCLCSEASVNQRLLWRLQTGGTKDTYESRNNLWERRNTRPQQAHHQRTIAFINLPMFYWRTYYSVYDTSCIIGFFLIRFVVMLSTTAPIRRQARRIGTIVIQSSNSKIWGIRNHETTATHGLPRTHRNRTKVLWNIPWLFLWTIF